MLAGVLTFAVLRPEEPSTHTHRRVAAPLVHGMPFRMSHNETASRLRAVASTTKLLTSDSVSPSSSQDEQGHGDDNVTAEEIISEKVTEDVWRGYSESNQEVYPVGEEKDAGSTDNEDDAGHDGATDADGAAMRTTGVTWALPEATAVAQASEASMILTNDTAISNGTDDASPKEIPPVR
jgi:hypothetical protein